MIILALWMMAGFFTILIYPHTPGMTDIRSFGDLTVLVMIWPFTLWIAYEASVYEEPPEKHYGTWIERNLHHG